MDKASLDVVHMYVFVFDSNGVSTLRKSRERNVHRFKRSHVTSARYSAAAISRIN